ncbi:MAG: peptidase M13 [Actinomycetales bacterium]|nr:peptidase M13 [Actinomycetales bacterium]
MTRSGIDTSTFDRAKKPGDDLFRHVNGTWLDSYEIPADRSRDGAFRRLYDQAELDVRAIIEDAAAKGESASGIERKVGDLFASFMDTGTVAAAGTAPLAEDLDLIRTAVGREGLVTALGALQRTGAASATGFWVDNDAKAPERYVVYLTQSGLGLPDESYYREPQHAETLAAYRPHVARMLLLGGWSASQDDADDDAARVVALETRLAGAHWDVVKDREADLTYNPMTLAALAELAPGFDWAAWVRALGAPEGALDQIVVREPDFAVELAKAWVEEDEGTWGDWLAYHAISARAAYLTDELVEANFDFYGRRLTGAQELRERWKRGVSLVEGAMGEAVGEVYVARHFPPSHKARMDELVANLVAAYRESITALEWMGEETRAKAITKLEKFNPKIGYPARWRDYDALEIDRTDLVGNVRRANAFEQDRELAKIGKPVDRDEWFMTPQTVNAYYNPGMNEIVFPAAILQPPFFDPEAEDAVNYGGIGAVIGHEIGHGFDDQGSKYDGDGRLEDWWTEEDRSEFEKRTKALIAQYDAYSPAQLDGTHHVNGALTIGENIGDLGGLAIALKAYRIALGTPLDEAPVIDGLTGTQRVFLGWAQAWQSKSRDEDAIRLLSVDPHSPAEFRCNGVVRNLDEFYTAFEVSTEDALWLDESERVAIW